MNQLNLSDVTWLILIENLRIIEISSAAFDRRMREQQPPVTSNREMIVICKEGICVNISVHRHLSLRVI
ncbi:hypothetical protein HanXRQr2_Chr13g0591981 [Helianthus annuus]|uniref:Uncharacterized protein n=1 Tax=Helianthus annuus TaxID=4232 RepID=A0A9K3EII9_HELAN|nr:hypothetical protein HanXRQr2_Chr13g0591981 [Helianthus annuus]